MRSLALAAFALALAPAPAVAQAAGEDSAVVAPKCDHDCLIRTVEAHMKALAARDPAQLRLAKDVRYAENDVLLPVGQGLWRTVTGVGHRCVIRSWRSMAGRALGAAGGRQDTR